MSECKHCGKEIPEDKAVCDECEKIHSAEIAAIRDFANRLLKAKFYVDCSFCEGRRHIEEAVSTNSIKNIRDGMINDLKN